MSIADDVTKLKAFCTECNDGTPGIFTWRLSNVTEQVSINNDYVPLCRKHYLSFSNKKQDEYKSYDHVYIKPIEIKKRCKTQVDEQLRKIDPIGITLDLK